MPTVTPAQLLGDLLSLFDDHPGDLVAGVTYPDLGNNLAVHFPPEPLDTPPLPFLFGVRVPEHWDALIVLTRGTTAAPDEPKDGQPVRVGLAVDRWNRSASMIQSSSAKELESTGVGLFPDTLRRCLDVPTEPPPSSTAPLYRERTDCRAGRLPSWRELRTASAEGRPGAPPVKPAVAAWMDDGMFARWLLASLPTSLAGCS